MNRHRRTLLPALALVALVATSVLPLGAIAAPAKPVASASVLPPDNAPFWTGKPNAAQFKARIRTRLKRAQAALNMLMAAKGPRTLANTLVPYDEVIRQIDMAGSQCGLVEETNPDSTTRVTAESMSQKVSKFVTDLSLNRKVYDALSALDLTHTDAATKFYVEKSLRDFRLAGVDKDEATRDKVKKLSDELVLISQEFGRNIREDKSTVTCTVAELDGLPADFIERHKPAADGTITLTTEYPDVVPVGNYAKSEALRKRLYTAFQNRAYPKNMSVLDQMRAKRHELATTLGFPNWADYVTADKMVGNAKTAQDFVARVVAASGDRQAREYQQLLAARRKDQPSATTVNFWESAYYSEQLRRSEYNFDSQSIRPYLPYDRVEQGILDLSAKLFDVQFKRVPNAPVWHPSVKCYELYDGGKLAGRFYLDMHPRANKYNHAAQFDIRTGIAGRQIPEAALVCNLSGGEKGDPGLCDYNDVNTFFHEFGHLLHTMFAGRQKWAGISGIRTEQDFVEAPSQMLEEWMRSPEVLASFAKHYQTNEPIPAALVQQMNRANDFGKGLQVRRQMVYAGMSLGYYDRDPAGVDSDQLMRDLVQKYQPFPYTEGVHFQCAFGHLDGYSAVYYTYMWSLVIAKDFFSQFDANHLMAPGVAKRYREAVLAPGGSKPAATLVSDFLGRPSNETAWKKWLDSDN